MIDKEPTQQEIGDKLTEMVHSWADVERGVVARYSRGMHKNSLPGAVKHAHRVEATFYWDSWGEPATQYVLMFDVNDAEARTRANDITPYEQYLSDEIRRHVQTWKSPSFRVQKLSRVRIGDGRECERHFGPPLPPDLSEAPVPKPLGAGPYVERDGYPSRPSRFRSTTPCSRPG